MPCPQLSWSRSIYVVTEIIHPVHQKVSKFTELGIQWKVTMTTRICLNGLLGYPELLPPSHESSHIGAPTLVKEQLCSA
jgi:hypothetical protein